MKISLVITDWRFRISCRRVPEAACGLDRLGDAAVKFPVFRDNYLRLFRQKEWTPDNPFQPNLRLIQFF